MYGLIRDRGTETHFAPVLDELIIVENTFHLLLFNCWLTYYYIT